MPDFNPSDSAKKIKEFMDKSKEYRSFSGKFKEKYGVDPSEITDDSSYVSAKMVSDAKDRISKGKKAGIPVYGNPLNQNTCAAGVCTIAADAGVDFSKMSGTINTGLATDSKGRKIPQYNPLIEKQISRAGYEEVPAGEKLRPGDLVQYFAPQEGSAMGEMVARHLEFVTEESDEPGVYKTFNNYGLYNEGKGESWVKPSPDGGPSSGSENMRESSSTKYYRLKPDEAARIVSGKKGLKDEKKMADGMTKDLIKIRDTVMPDESVNVFGSILVGLRQNKTKDQIKSSAMAMAKNKENVSMVIDELFK
jgi:hypothetical protein